MAEAAAKREAEQLVAELRTTLRHSLGSNLLPSVVDPADDRPNWQVDWPLTAVLIPLLLVASIALPAYPQVRDLQYRQLVLLQVWGAAFLWLVTLLGWLTKRAVVDRFIRELVPVLDVDSMRRAVKQLAEARERQRWLWPLLMPAAGSAPPDTAAVERLSALREQVQARNPGLRWRERLKVALPALPPLLALFKLDDFKDLAKAVLDFFLGP